MKTIYIVDVDKLGRAAMNALSANELVYRNQSVGSRRILKLLRKRIELPPEAPSFITRVCGSEFHIRRRWFGQAPSRCLLHKQLSGSGRAQSPQIAQALDVLQRVFGSPMTSAV